MSASHAKEPWPPRPVLLIALAGLLMIVLGMGWMMYNQFTLSNDKNTAQSNSVTMAQDIQRICKSEGKLLVDDRDLCAKGEAVLNDPTQSLSGPKGDRGNDGERGERGLQGFPGVKGDAGERGPIGARGEKGDQGNEGLDALGLPGADGVAGQDGSTGPVGPAGEPGADGAPGLPGKDGEPGRDGVDGAPGAPGADGAPGKDGRGLNDMQCANGRWTAYWSDGTTSDSGSCAANPAGGIIP